MFLDKCSVDGATSAATVNQSRGGNVSMISRHLDLYSVVRALSLPLNWQM